MQISARQKRSQQARL